MTCVYIFMYIPTCVHISNCQVHSATAQLCHDQWQPGSLGDIHGKFIEKARILWEIHWINME